MSFRARTLTALALSSLSFAAAAQPVASARLSLTPGLTAGVARGVVIVSVPSGYHAYSNPPTGESLIPLTVSAPSGSKLKLLRATYPQGVLKEFPGLGEGKQGVYEGEVRVPVELRVPGNAAGELPVKLQVLTQLCDDTACYPPQTELVSATLKIQRTPPAGSTAGPVRPQQPTEDVPPPNEPLKETQGQDPQPEVTGQPTPEPPPAAASYPSRADERPVGAGAAEQESMSLLALLLSALLAGLAVNLTPCVYPLIPITLSFFANQAAGSTAGRFGLGAAYASGIAISFGIFGAVMVLLGRGLGTIFQSPWFNVFLVALLIGLALSMFGLYEIRLPGFLQTQLKGRSGGAGAFIMGSLLGVGAAPCATAVIAALAVLVADRGDFLFGMAVFLTIGLGLGLPYMFLAALGAQLPRSADWLTSVKRILGLAVILLAVTLYGKQALTGFGVPLDTVFAINAAVFMLGAAFLVYYDRTFSSRIVTVLRAAAVIAAVFLGTGAYMARAEILRDRQFDALSRQVEQGVGRRIRWEPFTIEAFERALTEGRPVVVDGTADWCAACQEIEHLTLSDPRVIVNMRDVRAFRMDLSTGVDPAYSGMTQRHFGWKSLPHVRFYNRRGQLLHIGNEFIGVEDWLKVLQEAGVAVVR